MLAAGVGLAAFIVGSFLVRFVNNEGKGNALDLVLYFYPLYDATYSRVAQLHVPLWNPFHLCGVPWLATLQGGFFYPTHLLYVLLPLNWALETSAILHLVIAGIAMAAFARRIGLCAPAALLGAVLFSLRGRVAGSIGEPNALEAIVWLPVGALALADLARTGSARAAGLFAIAIGLSFLAGYPQPSVYSLYAYASFLPAMLIAERASARRWLTTGALAGAAALLGFALAAAQLVPTAELIRYGGARSTSALEMRAMVIFPQGWAWLTAMIGGDPGSVGAIAWGLFAAAPFAATRRARAVGLWAIGFTVLTGLWSFGPSTRAFNLYLALPGLSWFRNPQRILVVTDFSIATAAAVGLDAVVRAARPRAQAAAGTTRLAAAPLAALVGATVAVLLAMRGFAPEASLGSLWIAAAAAASVLLLALDRPRFLPSGAIGALLLVLCASEISNLPPFPFRMPYEDTDITAYRRSEDGLQELKSAAGPQRVWISGAGFSLDAGPKIAARYGLHAINDYEPVSLQRQAQYFRYLTEASTTRLRPPYVFLGDVGVLDSPRGVAPPATRRRLLDLAAMRFLVQLHTPAFSYPASDEAFVTDGGFVRRPDLWSKTDVWENPHALPRAYVTYRTLPAPPAEELLGAISQESYDPLAATYVEAPALPAAEGAPPRGQPAEIVVDTERIVEVDASLDAPGMVVLADTAFPGWKATVDGTPAPIYVANFLFRAVPAPAGRHRIRFEYRPASVVVGVASTAIAAVVCAALLFVGDRRRRALSG